MRIYKFGYWIDKIVIDMINMYLKVGILFGLKLEYENGAIWYEKI